MCEKLRLRRCETELESESGSLRSSEESERAIGSGSFERVWVGETVSDEKCRVLKSECGLKRLGDWKWDEKFEEIWCGNRGGGSIEEDEMNCMGGKRKDRSKSLRSCRDANGGISRVLE